MASRPSAWPDLAPIRRAAVPLFTVLALLAAAATYVFRAETSRVEGDLETAVVSQFSDARKLARQPASIVRQEVELVERRNDSRLYALYEGGRQTAGPRFERVELPQREAYKPARYQVRTPAGSEAVYGDWIPYGADGWLFYGERVAPYMRRAYSLAFAIVGGGVLAGGVLTVWGVFSERRFRRRLQSIERNLDEFAEGSLEVRLPVQGADDIDRVSRQVNQTLGRVQRLVTSLRLLGDHIAHEMKGGVGRVRRRVGKAEAAKDEAERERWLAEIRAECNAVLGAVDAILTLGAIELRDLQLLDPVAFDVEIGRTADMMQLVADDIGLQVMLTLSPVLVRGDPGLLSQMFANLFENAIKYGAEGGVVEIGLSSAKGLAVLTVADRGLGIPEASREAIFLPGRRLDRGRVEEGYGYGLAFVRTVVLAHGGKIRVEDARPGARFVVELPLAAPTLAMAGREDRSPSHSKSGSARALARP